MKCFKTFIRLTLMEQTTVTKTHFSAVLQPGQFMASKVELSLMWGCNRKTATRIIREFNQMGILRSEPSNRTTIHTLLCLSVWFTDQRTIKNPFFVSKRNRQDRLTMSHLKVVLKQLKSVSRHQQIQVGHLLPIQATWLRSCRPNLWQK